MLQGGGLSLHQISYAQLSVFHVCLLFLLLAMLRAGCRRFLVLVFVVALAANIGFSSFYATILTESLFFSLSAIMIAFLLDYLRTGAQDSFRARACWLACYMVLACGHHPDPNAVRCSLVEMEQA